MISIGLPAEIGTDVNSVEEKVAAESYRLIVRVVGRAVELIGSQANVRDPHRGVAGSDR